MATKKEPDRGSPASLVAIVVGARRAGDRELERLMRDELRDRYGIRIAFAQTDRRDDGKAVTK